MDRRFGRCRYFIILDPDTMEFEAVENGAAMAGGGAGPQAARTISDSGAEVLITGNVGPNAFQALDAAGIRIVTGASGTVRETMEAYKKGLLQDAGGATVSSHAGMR